MSDLDLRLAVTGILADELAVVTDAMIDAGSRAESALSVETGPDGKRRLRMVPEGQRLAVIWRAMLRAKLGERLEAE